VNTFKQVHQTHITNYTDALN